MRPDGHLGANTMNLTVIADFEDNGAKSATRPPCPSHCLWRIVWRRSLLNLCTLLRVPTTNPRRPPLDSRHYVYVYC